MEVSRANSYKSCHASDEEWIAEFWDWMNYELQERLVPGVDSPVKHVPEEVVEYITDINNFIRDNETDLVPEYGYMKKQKDINEKMRAILIDWLIEVHYKFKLNADTLFITVNIIDRYLSTQTVKRQYLQLVGVTAMLIASKYEDIYPPPIQDFIYITDNAYT